MWRVRLYIFSQSLLYKFPRLRNWARSSYLYRTLPPLLFSFSQDYIDRRYMTEHILPVLARAKVQRVLL
jgi:hypothetical protein